MRCFRNCARRRFEGLLDQMEELRRRLEQEIEVDDHGGKHSKSTATFSEARES